MFETHTQANVNMKPNPNEDTFEKKWPQFNWWTSIIESVVKSIFTNGLISFLEHASSNSWEWLPRCHRIYEKVREKMLGMSEHCIWDLKMFRLL